MQIMLVDSRYQFLDLSETKHMSKNMIRMIVFGLWLAFIAEVCGQISFCGSGIYEGACVGDVCCHGWVVLDFGAYSVKGFQLPLFVSALLVSVWDKFLQ